MTDPTLLLPREHPQPRCRAAVTEPRPRAVYLRRRITAIVILVAVVVLLGWLIASAVTRSATPSPRAVARGHATGGRRPGRELRCRLVRGNGTAAR